jgi:hypothetical protein
VTKPRPLKIPSKAQEEERAAIELFRDRRPEMLADRVQTGCLSKEERDFVAELVRQVGRGNNPAPRQPRSRKDTWSMRLQIAKAVAMLEADGAQREGVQRKRAIAAVVEVFGVSPRHVESVLAEFSTSIDEMRAHVDRLIADLRTTRFTQTDDLHVRWIDDREAASAINDEPAELNLPHIRTALDYLTCLHELGHIAGRHQNSANVKTRERWAWRYARQHALIWNAEMESFMTAQN